MALARDEHKIEFGVVERPVELEPHEITIA
jgi:hypothetical protein